MRFYSYAGYPVLRQSTGRRLPADEALQNLLHSWRPMDCLTRSSSLSTFCARSFSQIVSVAYPHKAVDLLTEIQLLFGKTRDVGFKPPALLPRAFAIFS